MERKRASRCVEKMSMATFIWERGADVYALLFL
jgi:hypothetical protein